MSSPWLHVKTIICCYAVLSLPYTTLALSLRPVSSRNANLNDGQALPDVQHLTLKPIENNIQRDTMVNSTTVTYNIPEAQQEIIYFRNFTEVGRKSEGFNITHYDTQHFPDRMSLSGPERFDLGDSAIKFVAAGIIAGVGLAAACVLLSATCGTYIGTNIGKFVTALGANGGQAAIDLAAAGPQAFVGNLPAAAGLKIKRATGELHEGFGCYYQDGYNGVCNNQALTGPAFSAIVQNDGATDQTPIWSCYEAMNTNGEPFGYYTHCFGDSIDCHLQCGANNPDVNSPYNGIPNPPA